MPQCFPLDVAKRNVFSIFGSSCSTSEKSITTATSPHSGVPSDTARRCAGAAVRASATKECGAAAAERLLQLPSPPGEKKEKRLEGGVLSV
jgi:hypothetical protein